MDERTIEFSCNLFSGFQVEIDIDLLNSLEEVTEKAVKNLREFLAKNNLEVLKEKLDKKEYHIHGPTWFDILQNPNYKIYVCCHTEE